MAVCTTHLKLSDLTPSEQEAYQRIVSNEVDGIDIYDKNFEEIGVVEGYFCFRNTYKLEKGNANELQALIMKAAQDDLRYRAAMLDADAITDEECVREGVNWGKNCWASATCTAKAVKKKTQ